MKQFYTYILASRKNGTLYVGVTSDLQKRVFEHKDNLIEGFTKKYNLHILVYFEVHADIQEAIIREKQIRIASSRAAGLEMTVDIRVLLQTCKA